jgi:RNA polymerase sigma-70 factor, ECF subfamily
LKSTRRHHPVQSHDRNEATPQTTSSVAPDTAVSEQLWHDVHERLTAFVAQRVDDHADVADIVQTVFLRVHQHAASVVDQHRLLPWLFQVTRNAIADYYRAPARRREVATVTPEGTMQFGQSTHPTDTGVASARESVAANNAAAAEGATALSELANCVRPMLQQLPLKYREALTLVEFEELSQVEVATRLGMSVSGMKSRVQRGRSMLRDVLLACCDVSRSATGGVLNYEPRAGAGCNAAGCAHADDARHEPALPHRNR